MERQSDWDDEEVVAFTKRVDEALVVLGFEQFRFELKGDTDEAEGF